MIPEQTPQLGPAPVKSGFKEYLTWQALSCAALPGHGLALMLLTVGAAG